jgi:hypothetical protein
MAATHPPAGTQHLARVRWTVPLAVFIALHGIAHFVGVRSNLNRANDRTTAEYLGGAWSISSSSALRVLAVIWALVGLGVIAASVLLAMRPATARPYLTVALAVSLVLCVLSLWTAVVGAVINVALLVLMWWASRSLFRPPEAGSTGQR